MADTDCSMLDLSLCRLLHDQLRHGHIWKCHVIDERKVRHRHCRLRLSWRMYLASSLPIVFVLLLAGGCIVLDALHVTSVKLKGLVNSTHVSALRRSVLHKAPLVLRDRDEDVAALLIERFKSGCFRHHIGILNAGKIGQSLFQSRRMDLRLANKQLQKVIVHGRVV